MTTIVKRPANQDAIDADLAERELAWKSMNPLLQQECTKITTELLEQLKGSVIRHHQLGKKLTDINSNSKYGDGSIEKMTKFIPSSEATLRRSMDLYQQFSLPDLKGMMDRAIEAGNLLSLSHLHILLAVEDKQQQMELLELIIEQGMSMKILQQEIKDRKYPEGTLARDVAPRDVSSGLRQMEHMTRTLIDKFDGPFQTVVLGPLQELQDKHATDELIKAINVSEANLQELANKLDSAARAMELIKEHVRLLMDQRAQKNAEAAQQNAASQSSSPPAEDPDDSTEEAQKTRRRRPLA